MLDVVCCVLHIRYQEHKLETTPIAPKKISYRRQWVQVEKNGNETYLSIP